MADRKQLINAEAHAHAQQLIAFAKQHDVGFVVMLVDKDLKDLTVVSNLTRPQQEACAVAWMEEPTRQSFHDPGDAS